MPQSQDPRRIRIGYLSHTRTNKSKFAVFQRDLGQCQDCLAEEPPVTTNHPHDQWHAVHRATTKTLNDDHADFALDTPDPDHPDNLITLCLAHIDYRTFGYSLTDYRRPTTRPKPTTNAPNDDNPSTPSSSNSLASTTTTTYQPSMQHDPAELPDDVVPINHRISQTTRGQMRQQAHKEHISKDKMYRRCVEAGYMLYALAQFHSDPANRTKPLSDPDLDISLTFEDFFPGADPDIQATPEGFLPPPRSRPNLRMNKSRQQQPSPQLPWQSNPKIKIVTHQPPPQFPPQRLPITDAPILNSRDYYDALTQAQLEADDHRLQKERLIHYDRHNLIPNHPDDTQFLLDNPEFNLDKIRIDWVLAHMYDLPEPKWTVVDVDF